MPDPGPTPHDRLDALRVRFHARAAGWWRVAGDRLEQVAFCAAADMPDSVVRDFARAALSVPLSAGDLGIVRAANRGEPAVSRASELPADTGSGLWLGRFGAIRSVAVPVCEASGSVVRVVSLALAGATPEDADVAEAISTE